MGCINEYKLYQFWWVVYYCVTKIRDYLEDLDTVRSEDPVGVWLEFNQGWRLIWAVSEDRVTNMLRHGNFHREHDDYIIYNQYWPVGLIFLRVSISLHPFGWYVAIWERPTWWIPKNCLESALGFMISYLVLSKTGVYGQNSMLNQVNHHVPMLGTQFS